MSLKDFLAVLRQGNKSEITPRDMRHVCRPTPVGHGCLATTCLETWPGTAFAIPVLPTIGSNDAVDGALRHDDPISEAQQSPQPAVFIRGMLPDQRKAPARKKSSALFRPPSAS